MLCGVFCCRFRNCFGIPAGINVKLYSNKDYSFLVLRHFSKNYDRWMYGYIADFATKISQLGFEDYVEWPELDTILSQIPINAGRVNCIFRLALLALKFARTTTDNFV